MNIKSNLMWMGAGLIVGSMYSNHKKDVQKVMDDVCDKATKKVTKLVNKM